jgi:hypothetical protein
MFVKIKYFLILAFFCLWLNTATTVFAGDVARDLKCMTGYTIVDATYISDVMHDSYGDILIQLGNGRVFKVSQLIFDPLVLTDIIIFSKKGHELFFYKVLIDNEIYDAEMVR